MDIHYKAGRWLELLKIVNFKFSRIFPPNVSDTSCSLVKIQIVGFNGGHNFGKFFGNLRNS